MAGHFIPSSAAEARPVAREDNAVRDGTHHAVKEAIETAVVDKGQETVIVDHGQATVIVADTRRCAERKTKTICGT